ncbi:MAG: alpha/beta hydrolase [Spirochaetes bacterium]|nr:alpha/beta hydrolase [Spirochaetota bacterium]
MSYRHIKIILSCILFLLGCLDNVIYHPDKNFPAIKDTPFSVEDVYIKVNESVTLHGWFIPAVNAHFTLCYFHGNAGNIADRIEKIYLFHTIPLSVFIIDYRGYGKSTGKPSERGLYKDAEATWNYLINTRKLSPRTIILYGESLGCPVSLYLASKIKPAGIIIDSSFTDVTSMVKHHSLGCMAIFFSESYPAIEYIKKIDIPILILHSKYDETVPFYMAEELYSACSSTKKHLVQLRGGHNNNFIVDAAIYRNSVKEFVISLSTQE